MHIDAYSDPEVWTASVLLLGLEENISPWVTVGPGETLEWHVPNPELVKKGVTSADLPLFVQCAT